MGQPILPNILWSFGFCSCIDHTLFVSLISCKPGALLPSTKKRHCVQIFFFFVAKTPFTLIGKKVFERLLMNKFECSIRCSCHDFWCVTWFLFKDMKSSFYNWKLFSPLKLALVFEGFLWINWDEQRKCNVILFYLKIK